MATAKSEYKRPKVGDEKIIKGVLHRLEFQRDKSGALIRKSGRNARHWVPVLTQAQSKEIKRIPKIYFKGGAWHVLNSNVDALDQAASIWCWMQNEPEDFAASINREDAIATMKALAGAR